MKIILRQSAIALAAFACAAALTACDQPRSQEAETSDAPVDVPIVAQTAPIAAATRASKIDGIATIADPGPLLQIDADIAAAKIAAKFSSGTLERFKSTKSLSRQTIENAAKQAGTDATQQKLLEFRLRQTWGDGSPLIDDNKRQTIVSNLTEGKTAIVRMDFPDFIAGTKPNAVTVTPLAGGAAASVTDLWVAPSGSRAMPGVSYYGLVDSGPGLRVGDRARVSANASSAESGVIIPSSALVVNAGQTWCYIETEPETYEKRVVPLDRPFNDGYLVTRGFKPGEKIVVRGASLLLAREAEPGSFDDDDDGPVRPRADKPAAKTTPDKDDDDGDKSAVKSPPKSGAAVDDGPSFAQRGDTSRRKDVDRD